MNKATKEFVSNTISDIKKVSKDNAIRYGKDDEGFELTLTGVEIRKETNRKRLDTSVKESIIKHIKKEGINAELIENDILITVPPILSQNTSLSLTELREKQAIIEELNIREEWEQINS